MKPHRTGLTVAERDRRTLVNLDAEEWLRPMDLGGSDASYHSASLARLVARGLAERKCRGSDRSFRYRLTAEGQQAAADAVRVGGRYQ